MNQRLAAHVTGWVSFGALAVVLASGYVMSMDWSIKRKLSYNWHKAWTIIAIAATCVHFTTQNRLTYTNSWVIWGWVALAGLVYGWINKGPRNVHKWVGLAAYGFGTYHTLMYTKHANGNAPLWGIAGATAVIIWLLGARYTIVAPPRTQMVKIGAKNRWTTADGSISARTKWGVRAKQRRIALEKRSTPVN